MDFNLDSELIYWLPPLKLRSRLVSNPGDLTAAKRSGYAWMPRYIFRLVCCEQQPAGEPDEFLFAYYLLCISKLFWDQDQERTKPSAKPYQTELQKLHI